MGLKHDLKITRKKLAALDNTEHKTLISICIEIHGAQQALTEKAAPLLDQCMTRCQGLCCRNIRVADIITKWDLIYILAMRPELESSMARCLENEDMFTADCLFLENGIGPCLFPDYVRPERCILSFCRVEPLVEKEIAQVMKGFSRLIRFFLFMPLYRLYRRVVPKSTRSRPNYK